MIVSHKYKFIFIKTKKTAGTSVEIALSRFCGDQDIITAISPESPEQLQAMGFKGPQNDRLPLRKWSAKDWRLFFQPHRKGYGLHSHMSAARVKEIVGDKQWSHYFTFSIERNPFDRLISYYYWHVRHVKNPPSLENYLLTLNPKAVSNWPLYAVGDKIAVDYILRYESLAEGLHYVQRVIGLPSPIQLPQAKSATRKNRQHYSQIITPVVRARIEALCAKEIAAFSYQW